MRNLAAITPVLAAGSTTSPYAFLVSIAQRLCFPACSDSAPVFNPTFALVDYTLLGGSTYVATIKVQGLISYTPCRSDNCCCTKTQVVNQTFSVPFTSATAPTSVTISQGTPVNMVGSDPCQTCSRAFISECPLYLAVA